MSLGNIDKRYQDPPCECGDPFCSGCDWDDDDDDEYEDDGFYDDDLYPYLDDLENAPLSTLEQPLTQNDEDEIPF